MSADELILAVLQEGKIPNPIAATIPAAAPRRYKSRREGGSGYAMTPDETDTYRTTYALKKGDPEAVSKAAREMSRLTSKKSTLVPIPSRSGDTSVNLALAHSIAKHSGAEVADVLTRSKPAMSSKEAKEKIGHSLAVNQHNMTTKTPFSPPHDRRVQFVDNLAASGSTLAAARAALGGRGHGLTYSRGPLRRFEIPRKEPGWKETGRIAPVARELTAQHADSGSGHSGYYDFSDGTKIFYGARTSRDTHVIYDKEGRHLGTAQVARKGKRERSTWPEQFTDHLRLVGRHRDFLTGVRERKTRQVSDIPMSHVAHDDWSRIARSHDIHL